MSDFSGEQAASDDSDGSNHNTESQIVGWFIGEGVQMDVKEVDRLIATFDSFTESDDYTIWLNAKRDAAELAQNIDGTFQEQPSVILFTLEDIPVLLTIYAVHLMMLLDDINLASGEEPEQTERRALKTKEYQREKTIHDSLYNFIKLSDEGRAHY
jgi:hypothetical protein